MSFLGGFISGIFATVFVVGVVIWWEMHQDDKNNWMDDYK